MTPLEQYVGKVLDDKYRLERLLGQGGMGAVYLATHLGTDRYVALKLIVPQFMRNEEFVERVKVLDFGIAKLGEAAPADLELIPCAQIDDETASLARVPQTVAAVAGSPESDLGRIALAPVENLEAATLIQSTDRNDEPSPD